MCRNWILRTNRINWGKNFLLGEKQIWWGLLDFEQNKIFSARLWIRNYLCPEELFGEHTSFLWTKCTFRSEVVRSNSGRTMRVAFYLPRGTFRWQFFFETNMIFRFFETLLKKVSTGCELCRISVQKKLCREKNLFCEGNKFFVHTFSNWIVAGLSKLHLICREEHLDGKLSGPLGKDFLKWLSDGCQLVLRSSLLVFFQKIFPRFFSGWGQNVSNFW